MNKIWLPRAICGEVRPTGPIKTVLLGCANADYQRSLKPLDIS